jgi:hypothetical protein
LLNTILGSLSSSALPVVPNSYESIATVTVGSGGAASVTFSSIPADYTHLQIRAFMVGGSYTTIRFNSDTTTSNYRNHWITGNGSSVSSSTNANNAYTPMSASANGYADIIDILDYANTNKYKTIRALEGYDNNGSGEVYLSSNLWMSTAAISSIVFTPNSSMSQYSQFALYGIKGA